MVVVDGGENKKRKELSLIKYVFTRNVLNFFVASSSFTKFSSHSVARQCRNFFSPNPKRSSS